MRETWRFVVSDGVYTWPWQEPRRWNFKRSYCYSLRDCVKLQLIHILELFERVHPSDDLVDMLKEGMKTNNKPKVGSRCMKVQPSIGFFLRQEPEIEKLTAFSSKMDKRAALPSTSESLEFKSWMAASSYTWRGPEETLLRLSMARPWIWRWSLIFFDTKIRVCFKSLF